MLTSVLGCRLQHFFFLFVRAFIRHAAEQNTVRVKGHQRPKLRPVVCNGSSASWWWIMSRHFIHANLQGWSHQSDLWKEEAHAGVQSGARNVQWSIQSCRYPNVVLLEWLLTNSRHDSWKSFYCYCTESNLLMTTWWSHDLKTCTQGIDCRPVVHFLVSGQHSLTAGSEREKGLWLCSIFRVELE